MWVGIKGIMGNQAGKMDKGIATLRAQNGKMVSSSKGKREVPVEHYRKLGSSTRNSRKKATCGQRRIEGRENGRIVARKNCRESLSESK